jgi:hypothetical protein
MSAALALRASILDVKRGYSYRVAFTRYVDGSQMRESRGDREDGGDAGEITYHAFPTFPIFLTFPTFLMY